jgi:hypothetical protein
MALDGSSTTDDLGVGFQTVSIEAATMNGAASMRPNERWDVLLAALLHR